MKHVISTGPIPIMMWLDLKNLEEGALNQAMHLANLPFAFHHIALMGGCHKGYGMPIESIIATKDVIIPYAVGKDIGCGVSFVKTNLYEEELSKGTRKRLMDEIRKVIPLGKNHHKEKQDISLMPLNDMPGLENTVVGEQYESALKQLGTLGGGNHFIEFQVDEDENVGIMLHSGSRNLGNRVCDHYNDIAKKLNEKWFSSIPTKWDLAFLPIDTQEAYLYRKEMDFCIRFAAANRLLMMNRIKDIFRNEFPGIIFYDMVDTKHNYAAMENHYNQNVMVHRKGSVMAREGTIVLIPGSQGSHSYIARGLGNKRSFNSCSHGAGRSMSITAAIKNLDFEEERKKLDDLGTVHTLNSKDDLGESDGAYKDISIVMKDQTDLVEIISELTPMATLKAKYKKRRK